MTTYKSYIGAADMNFWDGVSRTFTRKTSTGGSLTLNRVGVLCNILDVYGSGTAFTDTTISTALGRIGSGNVGLLLVPGTWTISNDLTIPANTPLYLMPGAVVTVASGKTLTVNSQPEAGPYQVFAGSGSFTFATGLRLLSSWFASFSTAITKISTATVTLEVTEAETISADTTVAATTTLLWLSKYTLTVAAAKTLTLNGPIVAGPYEILAGTGILAGTPTALKVLAWVNATLTDGATWDIAMSGLQIDTIAEATAAAGVTIDGVKLKDSIPYCDTISEKTDATGVTIDGVKLKDSIPYCDTITEKTAGAGITIDGFKIKDTAPDPTVWPAFRATLSGNQNIAASTPTKIQFNTETFDTNSNYDNATNYRFTPTAAGYYLVEIHAILGSCISEQFTLHLYKNGASHAVSSKILSSATDDFTVLTIVQMNGSTDYLEAYIDSATDTSYDVAGTAVNSRFSASRIA